MIGPIFKVVCETCGKFLAPSSVKKHKEKVCMNKDTNAEAVEKETNDAASSTTTSGSAVPSATSEGSQESSFSKESREHVKRTEEIMVEAADNAELINHAKEISQKVRERTKINPGMDCLAMTLHLDDWFNEIGPVDKEVKEGDDMEEEEVTEEQELERVEITALTQEVTPEDTPLPETPKLYKLKKRDCAVCGMWFNSMVDLMLHVVEVHGVETGATSPVVFMMAEQLGNQQDQLEATKLQLETIREENRQFKHYVSQTLMQDMLEGMRKVVKSEMEEKEKSKEKPKEKPEKDDDSEVEVIESDKNKIVKEVEMLECPGCDYTTTNKQYMKTHMTKHKKKNSFNCTKCVKKFATEHSLKQHMESQHKETPRLPVGHSQWAQQRNGETVRCTKCPRDLKGETELNLHMKKDHSHKCMECGVVHDNRDTLIVHLREVHSIDIYVDWKCNSCQEIFNGKEHLTKHKCPEHSNFQEVSMPVCRYWRQGRCREGEGCKFAHPQQQQQQRQGGGQQSREFTPACVRGDRCGYLANGCCNFFHRGVGVQQPRRGGREGRGGQGGQGGRRVQGGQQGRQGGFAMARVIQENY